MFRPPVACDDGVWGAASYVFCPQTTAVCSYAYAENYSVGKTTPIYSVKSSKNPLICVVFRRDVQRTRWQECARLVDLFFFWCYGPTTPWLRAALAFFTCSTLFLRKRRSHVVCAGCVGMSYFTLLSCCEIVGGVCRFFPELSMFCHVSLSLFCSTPRSARKLHNKRTKYIQSWCLSSLLLYRSVSWLRLSG